VHFHLQSKAIGKLDISPKITTCQQRIQTYTVTSSNGHFPKNTELIAENKALIRVACDPSKNLTALTLDFDSQHLQIAQIKPFSLIQISPKSFFIPERVAEFKLVFEFV
jgi:hypothetical protein